MKKMEGRRSGDETATGKMTSADGDGAGAD
jgi:hypothetical protein